jgi:hypothetical protein
VRAVGLLAGAERFVRGADGGDRLYALERVRKRLDPGRAQRLELAPPRREQLLWGALVA